MPISRYLTTILSAVVLLAGLIAPAPAAHAATLTVSTTADNVLVDAQCSLREAIISANTNPGFGVLGECLRGSATATDTIVLENGAVYELTLGGNDNNAQSGDLDILNDALRLDLVITTADPDGDAATINASNLPVPDRVFEVLDGAGVRLENINVQGGSTASSGGGIANDGELELRQVYVGGNAVTFAASSGGGIANSAAATLTLVDSRVVGNTMSTGGNGAGIANYGSLGIQSLSQVFSNQINGAGDGAGIYNSGGSVVISDAAVVANRIDGAGDGAGIYNSGGNVALSNAQLPGNLSLGGSGGAIFNAAGANLDISGSVISAGNAEVDGGGIYNAGAATLVDVTVGAQPAPNSANDDGGGIYNAAGAEMTISGGAISYNQTSPLLGAPAAGGGGIYNEGVLHLTNVIVGPNRTGDGDSSRGGGIFNRGELAISGGAITGNRTGDGNLADGGGIAHYDGNLLIEGTTISGNQTGGGSPSRGGGIYVRLGAMLIGHDMLISENQTGAGSDSDGGGVWNDGGLELYSSLVRLNQAGGSDNDGGGIANEGVATLIDTTIAENQASALGNSADGGGIFNLSVLNMRNVTVSGNGAQTLGGGVYSGNGSTLRMAAGTISGNSVAEGSAGGLFVDNGALEARLGLSLIAGNSAPFNPDCEDVVSTIASDGHNLIGVGSGSGAGCPTLVHGVSGDVVGTAATPLAALLGPLANNGGPVPTHALRSGSPAIDLAQPASCQDWGGAPILADQRGVERPAGGGCDAGAYEAGLLRVYLPLTNR